MKKERYRDEGYERALRIELYHRQEGTDQAWTRERFETLCRQLECTGEELAALFCLPTKTLRRWLQEDFIPAHWALHLVLLERAYWNSKYGVVGPPVVPLQELICK